ncbi:MAG: hypothetical protein ACJ8C4_09910 [Gemmataceae bacterium]
MLPTKMSELRTRDVKHAVAAIKRFHAIGGLAPKTGSPAATYGAKAMKAFAAEHNLNEDTGRKARAFAAMYSVQDVGRLCRQVEERILDAAGRVKPECRHRSVFGRTHLIRLLSVPQKRVREALQHAAIEQGWSLASLESAIAVRFGSRRAGGRAPKVPRTVKELYGQLEQRCESWNRWLMWLDRSGLLRDSNADLRGLLDQLRMHLKTIQSLTLRRLKRPIVHAHANTIRERD